jgi:hypothetical protein
MLALAMSSRHGPRVSIRSLAVGLPGSTNPTANVPLYAPRDAASTRVRCPDESTPLTTKLFLPSCCAWTIAGNGTRAGSGTVRLPLPFTVTKSFSFVTEVVDGAGASVVVVAGEVDVVVEAAVVVDAGGAAFVGEPESQAAPKTIAVVTNAMTAHVRLVSGRSHA